MISNDFQELGYDVDYKLLKASEYGVPQNRERVFIIGNRLGLKNPFPKKHTVHLIIYFIKILNHLLL